DLRGKKLAVNNQRGMTEYFTHQFLQLGGLSIDDVELVVLPFPEMLQALENGAVDAAYLQHPLAAVALNPGPNGEPPSAVELVRFSDVLDAEQMAVFVYGKNLLEPENRETAVGVTIALTKAFRALQGDAWRSDPVIVQAFVDYTGQPEDAVRRSVIPYFEPNGRLDGTSLLDMQSYYLERGYTEYSDPLSLEEIVITDFQEEAIERLGAFQ
ncbi:MAG TPA: ABC transporter substrate-binding protein, partial [Anaerolineaceae bacterium]|nr:ABC transporter substrate-binding protein [Anaerolineaceae bacterium]